MLKKLARFTTCGIGWMVSTLEKKKYKKIDK
jgi:hypothetical protein